MTQTTEKRNPKIVRLTAMLVIIALVTTVVISGVYAKYTSTFSGTGTIIVAKWNPSVDFDEGETFDLASTSYNNVLAGKIAPGTSGQFAVGIEANDTEVAIDYVATISFPNDFPADQIKFYSDSGFSSEIQVVNAPDGKIEYNIDGNIPLHDTVQKTHTFYWQWEYHVDDATDDLDTQLGKDVATYTGDVRIVATQQIPTP